MKYRKLTTLALAAGVILGASVCSSSTGAQQDDAMKELHRLGFTKVESKGDDALPFGTGEMLFMGDLPKCRGLLVGMQPGSTSVDYRSVNGAEADLVLKQRRQYETFGDAYLRWCGAPQG